MREKNSYLEGIVGGEKNNLCGKPHRLFTFYDEMYCLLCSLSGV